MKECLVCQASVSLLFIRGRRGSTVSFRDGTIQLVSANGVRVLCDRCFSVASRSRLAWTWLCVEIETTAVGLTRHGFGWVARTHGLSFRGLKKRLARAGRVIRATKRHKTGAHNWAEKEVDARFFRANPWLLHLIGGYATIGVAASLFFGKKAA